MRAYDMAMVLIFVNCAFMIIITMGIPITSDTVTESASIFDTLSTWFATELFNIAGIQVTTMTLLAVAFAAGTIVVLNSNPVTDKGLAMTTFTAVFWGSWTVTSVVIGSLLDEYNVGLGVFYIIFFIASTLIFINALVQLSTGGQQSHV